MLSTRLAIWATSGAIGLGGFACGSLFDSSLALPALIAASSGGWGLLTWFVPPARVVKVHPSSIELGTMVALPTSAGAPTALLTASPVIAYWTDDASDATSFRIGLKNGSVYGCDPATGTLPIIARNDAFAAVRAEWTEPEPLDPLSELWLEPLVAAVDVRETHDGPTLEKSAVVADVAVELKSQGLDDADDLRRTIDLARGLGLIERARPRRARLALTDAGRLWLTVTRARDDAELTRASAFEGETSERFRRDLTDPEIGGGRLDIPEPDAFGRWVIDLVDTFRRTIEHGPGRRSLWSREHTPQDEAGVQAVFFLALRVYCQLMDVDISPESDAGNGPVDFKFSHGWSRRAIVEVKLLSSSRHLHGIEKQLPAYIEAEDVTQAVYLCIGLSDADLDPARLDRIERLRKATVERTGAHIECIFVDARLKPSASKR